MKHVVLCFTAVLLLATSLHGWDWPIENGAIVAVVGPFRGASLLPGLLIAGEGKPVRATEDGEVIFASDSDRCAACLPSPLGAVAVLDHARGFRSIYGHLDGLVHLAGSVVAGTNLGRVGQTGSALGLQLFFAVVDTQRSLVVNPLLLLPRIEDSLSPVIRSIDLVADSGGSTEKLTMRIVVDAVDRLRTQFGVTEVFPYSIALLVDGQVQLQLLLDTLRVDPVRGEWLTAGGEPIGGMVLPDMTMDLGAYPVVRGITTFEVVVSDHAGNRATRRVLVPTESEAYRGSEESVRPSPP